MPGWSSRNRGVPPRVNLDKSVEISLHVNGVQAYGNLGRSCDKPSFLGKDTVSGVDGDELRSRLCGGTCPRSLCDSLDLAIADSRGNLFTVGQCGVLVRAEFGG